MQRAGLDGTAISSTTTVDSVKSPEQMKEQQLIERTKRPDGSVVETLSVRRPSISDPNRLGNLQKLSETVCKGKCDAKP